MTNLKRALQTFKDLLASTLGDTGHPWRSLRLRDTPLAKPSLSPFSKLWSHLVALSRFFETLIACSWFWSPQLDSIQLNSDVRRQALRQFLVVFLRLCHPACVPVLCRSWILLLNLFAAALVFFVVFSFQFSLSLESTSTICYLHFNIPLPSLQVSFLPWKLYA